MKKMIVLALCMLLVTAMLLTGCNPAMQAGESGSDASESTAATAGEATAASDNNGAEQIVIGASFQNLQNEYIKQLADVIEAKAGEANVKLLVSDGEGDAATQVSAIENFISQGADAIILNPYDKDGCVPAAQKAAEAGIPIVVLVAHLTDESMIDSYVGSSDVTAGELEMQRIADAIGGKGNICVIEGPTGISAAAERQEGINNILEKYPDIKIIYSQPADWDRAKAMNLMENWLQTGEEINAVVAHNDEMALGAFKALEAANKAEQVPVIGIDGIPDSLNSVKAGGLNATVFQNSTSQAETAFEVAQKLANGETVEKLYDIPFELVTSENIDDYLS